jgi:hypothetical protein
MSCYIQLFQIALSSITTSDYDVLYSTVHVSSNNQQPILIESRCCFILSEIKQWYHSILWRQACMCTVLRVREDQWHDSDIVHVIDRLVHNSELCVTFRLETQLRLRSELFVGERRASNITVNWLQLVNRTPTSINSSDRSNHWAAWQEWICING